MAVSKKALTVVGLATLVIATAGSLVPVEASTANAASPRQAGYTASPNLATETAVTRFIAPVVTCNSRHFEDLGIGVFILQGGFISAESSLNLLCNGKGSAALYFPQYATPTTGGELNVAVHAGDSVKVTVSESANRTFLTFLNRTTGASQSVSGDGPGATPGAILVGTFDFTTAVPGFGHINFSHCHIDGLTLSAAGATAEDQVTTPPKVQIATGVLRGSGFREVFKNR